MRRTGIATLVAALLFGILSTWLGPKAISYWYRPPVPTGVAAAFNCTDAVDWAMNRLVWTQIWGSLVGAAVGFVVGLLWRRGAPAAEPVTPATAPTQTKG